MPEKQTPERGLPVPDGQNSQPESDGGAFELQLQLFELQQAERQLNRERERYRREEEALTEAQREARQETLKADELERTSNEATEKLIELDLRMGKSDQLKAVVEGKDVPALKPIVDGAKKDPALAEILDAYRSVQELYSKNTEAPLWPPKTAQQRHIVASSAVAMRELLVLGKARLGAMERGVKSIDNMWLKAQRRIPLGTSADVLRATMTTKESLDATFNNLFSRASALFSTPDKPGMDAKMAQLPEYLPDDPRAMAIAEGFYVQMQRFVSLTQKKDGDGKIVSSVSNDPAELAQVEDAIAWMERSADALNRYAAQNDRVKQYLAGTLPRAVIEEKPAEKPAAEPEAPTKIVKPSAINIEDPNVVNPKNIPERIPENLINVSTADRVFQDWENTWIESGKNSLFDRINTQYKAFREIRRQNKEDLTVKTTYDTILPLLKRYAELEAKIPHLIGEEASVSDMRAIEDVLINLDASLFAFQLAWKQKNAPADEEQVQQDAKIQEGLNLSQRAEDLLINGLNISVEKDAGEQPVVPTESASASVETAESARTFNIPRTAPFQIEVKDDARRTRHLPFTVGVDTSATRHGPVQINSTKEQWTLTVPSDFRGSIKIVQNGVEQQYTYGVNGPTVETQTPATPNVQKSIPVQPTIPTVEARQPSVETPMSGMIRVRNGGQVQFIEQNGRVSRGFVLNRSQGYPELTLDQYGTARFLPATNEWVMQTPPNIRQVIGAIDAVPEDPATRALYEKFAPQIAEYFEQTGGLDRLVKRIEALYAGRKEMLKDKPEYGGSIEWKTYAQEMQQLVSRYLLSLSSDGWPTDQAKRIELLSVAAESEQLIADYKTDRDTWEKTPPEEQDGVWKDIEKQKLPWDKRVTDAATAYRKLKAEFESSNNTKVNEVFEDFRKTMTIYSNIYKRLTAPNIYRDDRQIVATVEQMERVLHYYEPKLRKAAEVVQSVSNEKTGGSFLGGFLDQASAVVSNVTENGADNAALEKVMMDRMFKPGQSRFDIRQSLILGSTLKPLQKLSESEVESLLYIKAHLPDFAGRDGLLNGKDVSPIAELMAQNILRNPYALADRIIRERGMHPNSEEARGVKMALGLDQLRPDETSKLSMGRFMRDRPVLSLGMRLFAPRDWRYQLAKGENGIARVNQARWEIPAQVRERVLTELRGFITKSHVAIGKEQPDVGHAPLTEADMRAFEKHAAVLKEISRRSLEPVAKLTKAKIETYLPDGLSVEFIDWMLDAQTRADPVKGAPPGSTFWIEGAPVSTAAERRAKAGPVATKKPQDSAVEDADVGVDLGSPSVDLGSPSVDLGSPEPLQ